MTRRLAALVLLLSPALGPSTACADEADEALGKLAWMVGGKWVAEFKAPDGSVTTVELTVEWAGHRKALRYAIVFRGKESSVTQYEGTYWWDPIQKQLHLLQVDRSGNVTQATATVDGNTLKQANVVLKADGSKQDVRVESVRDGEDAFRFRGLIAREGKWIEGVSLVYRRVRTGK